MLFRAHINLGVLVPKTYLLRILQIDFSKFNFRPTKNVRFALFSHLNCGPGSLEKKHPLDFIVGE